MKGIAEVRRPIPIWTLALIKKSVVRFGANAPVLLIQNASEIIAVLAVNAFDATDTFRFMFCS
jgi:hypothetical protein